MSTHPRLVWPRSDGDKANWPDLKPSKPGGAWFEPISQNHIKYDNYEERAGEHLASILGIPKRPNGLLHRIPMPSGFKMFVHKQPRPTGEVREDFYCFGSNHNKRIRSAQEWKDHAEWLFSDKPFERHNSECGCFAKKGSRLAEASGSTPIKRPAAKVPVSASVPKAKKQRLSPVEPDEDVGPTGVAPERGHDLKYQRRFRRGELIWVRIDTIFPPPGTDLPEITHWPVLVADVRLRIHTPAPNPPATLADAAAPANPGATSHYWTYHLRPLGMFSRKDDIVRDIKDMLPWALGDELMGGQSGWQALAREGTRVLKAGVSKEAEEEKEKKSDTLYKDRWETNWAPRIKFADMGLNWEVAAVRIGVAIKTGILIARSWCQTDRIDIIGETILSTADRDLVDQGKKNFYQGLWLGGERIWAEDLVRLKKDRKELPPDLGAPETGAETRAVFLKIRAISLEKDETSDKQDIWRCIVSGDISELVQSATYHQSTWAVDETSTPLVQNYKAAKGYKYRQLHETGCEVSCDSSDIAGRVYPDLLDPETQNWYSLNDEEPIAEGRHAPGKVAQALVGIQPGTVACSSPKTWIEDLFAIVDAACKDAEKSARDFYVKEMEHALGKQGTPKKRKVDPIADSSTASTAATGTAGDGPAATLAAPGSAVSISATPVAPTSINGPTENNANGTTNAPSSTTIQTASAASVLNGAPPPAPAGVAAPAPAPARQSFPEVQFTPLAGVPNAARVGQP